MQWRWMASGPGGSAFNMALDEALVRADAIRPTLRTYCWTPHTLSLGYFQEVSKEDLRPFREAGLGVVRRPTGGGAIFHGDELTYAVCWPRDEPGIPRNAEDAYGFVHGFLSMALGRLGCISAPRGDRRLESDSRTGPDEFWCFYHSTSFDLASADRKLVGSAQRRTARGFLMHGSIPLAANPRTPLAAGAGVRYEALEAAIVTAAGEALGRALVPGTPTGEELALAKRLEKERYSREEWTIRRLTGGETGSR